MTVAGSTTVASSIALSIAPPIDRLFGAWGSTQRGLQDVITQPLANWLQTHPRLDWMVNHPLWMLGLALVALLLLSGLLKAIASFTEQIWIWLLRSPLILLGWLFNRLLRLARYKSAPPALPATPQQQRLTLILQKLETMRQEQDALLQEVRALLAIEESTRL